MTTIPGSANWRAANRANWDERVPIHAAGPFYDLPGFVAGKDSLRDFEIAEVGDVSGKTLLHLQCHIGLDTLSWARRGATVTGLDFSAPAVEVASSLAGEIGVTTARFVTSDVYDAVPALGAQTFDIVYTGFGALCWLPDLARWAQTVAALLAPGGFLYLAEFHPFADVLAEDGRTVENDYFQHGPIVVDAPGSYADPSAVTTRCRQRTGCRRPPPGVPPRVQPRSLPPPCGAGRPTGLLAPRREGAVGTAGADSVACLCRVASW